MNKLREVNSQRRAEFETYRAGRAKDHGTATSQPTVADYPLLRLQQRITTLLSDRLGCGPLEPRFDMTERAKFGGDISLKLPQLLSQGGPKAFIANHLPKVVELLSGEELKDAIVDVETKGMYVNLKLTNRWLLDSAQAVVDLGDRFSLNDALADRVHVVDYSSPNVAKVLHAGHIRSTIIGHVLSNLLEASGSLVYRVNHINDFGGFGFTLEGYRRFANLFPETLGENDRLLKIYSIRRTLERLVGADDGYSSMSDEDRHLIEAYFPEVTNESDLRQAFKVYAAASDARFESLENGVEEEVELWRSMVGWSLVEFDKFYRQLNIDFDLVIGESFYFDAGDAVVQDGLANGSAVEFKQSIADQEIDKLTQQLEAEDITPAEYDNRVEAIRKDVDAVVVALDDGNRYVIRRSDGRSIYSTRDLGAIKLRNEIFQPTDIVYVVGQEQRVHFSRLFESAYKLGLADPERLEFRHLYFGFYVDSTTGKKLSSRDTVSNVNQLLTESVSYFRSRLSERVDQSAEQVEHAAQELAVGSLVFNDLSQDMKGSVEIETLDINSTIESFEKSGGAYVVYAACRARGILRKYGKQPIPASEIETFEIDDQEAVLLLKLQEIPSKVAEAASQSNPSILVRHLLSIASTFNSYYARAEVITDGVANPSRLLITNAVQQALTSGLLLCHVTCPDAI